MSQLNRSILTRSTSSTKLWGAATAVVCAGWGAGYLFWREPTEFWAPSDDFGSYFDVYDPALTLLVGLPLAVASGFLLGRQGRARLLGYALLALTCLSLAYLAQFAFFGGFCLDPEDVCLTTWPSRLTELAAALSCVATGWIVQGFAGQPRRVQRGLKRR